MRKYWKMSLFSVLSLAFVGGMFIASIDRAEARPKYLKQFAGTYPKLATQAKKAKCAVCHPKKSKKIHNDYGIALKKAIGKKNEKDAKKIETALKKIEKEKSSVKDKTFGDLLKDEKLPGSKDAAKKEDN